MPLDSALTNGATGHCSNTEYSTNLLKTMRCLRQGAYFVDLHLIVGQEVIKCHRLVFAAVSEYIMSKLGQAGSDDVLPIKIEIPNLTPRYVSAAVDYTYTGHVCITWRNVNGLLDTARGLQMESLVVACSEFLANNLTVEKSCQIVCMADQYRLSSVKAAAAAFMRDNITSLQDTEELLALKPDLFVFLIEGFKWSSQKSDTMGATVMEDTTATSKTLAPIVFDVVCKYTGHDLQSRVNHLAPMLRHLPLGLLKSFLESAYLEKNHPSLYSSSTCMDIIQIEEYWQLLKTYPYPQRLWDVAIKHTFTTAKLDQLENDVIFSPPVTVNRCKWSIGIEVTREDNEKYLGVHVYCDVPEDVQGTRWSCNLRGTYRLMSRKPGKSLMLCVSNMADVDWEERAWGFQQFLSWKELYDTVSGFVQNGGITLDVQLQVSDLEVVEDEEEEEEEEEGDSDIKEVTESFTKL